MKFLNRTGTVATKTNETSVRVRVALDGVGKNSISTRLLFLDHMLSSFSFHSLIDLEVSSSGDLKHHIVEDTSLAIGRAISFALGTRSGIRRFGTAFAPMDDALASCHIDLVRRSYFVGKDLDLKRDYIEDMAKEDFIHFFSSLCKSLECGMHIRLEYGINDHHKAEACFKALALSMRQAIARDEMRELRIPSSKGKI